MSWIDTDFVEGVMTTTEFKYGLHIVYMKITRDFSETAVNKFKLLYDKLVEERQNGR